MVANCSKTVHCASHVMSTPVCTTVKASHAKTKWKGYDRCLNVPRPFQLVTCQIQQVYMLVYVCECVRMQLDPAEQMKYQLYCNVSCTQQ